jgi:N6-adenosine-specific RNA methylase IME4
VRIREGAGSVTDGAVNGARKVGKIGNAKSLSLNIADIKVGTRHRRDLGDIAGFAERIQRVGFLLQPLPIRPDGTLIAGERRLEACKLLGWQDVPVHVVPLDQDHLVLAEWAENADRKDFLPSEIVSILREIEPLERAAAKQRQQAGLKRGAEKPVGQILHNGGKGKARDKIARFAGISGYQLDKIKTVVEAAEEEPARYGHLVEVLDRPHGVAKAFHALRRARDEQRVLSLVPQPGKFRTLVLDPPWPYAEDISGPGKAAPYALMERDELLALPVASWAEDDCHLYLWATNSNMPLACECMAAWGFTHKSVLTWLKPGLGLGSYFRNTTEHVLFGLRGKLRLHSTTIPTHFEAPKTGHSEKPEAFYQIVRAASYLPAGEAFQRTPRDGFVNLFV